MVEKGLVSSRSQGENYINLGKVRVNGVAITKSGYFIKPTDKIELLQAEQYVSRAALKLASVADKLGLDFKDKVVLDVGSSTGGFTDYALRRGAKRVIAVDVGTDQLHVSLRDDTRIELHEKTDIRSLRLGNSEERIWNKESGKNPHSPFVILSSEPDIVAVDVSFISLRVVLPAIAALSNSQTKIVAMVKPQFEAGNAQTNKGVVKNDTLRRKILKDFEEWTKSRFVIIAKADSEVAGAKGNLERFYLLQPTI